MLEQLQKRQIPRLDNLPEELRLRLISLPIAALLPRMLFQILFCDSILIVELSIYSVLPFVITVFCSFLTRCNLPLNSKFFFLTAKMIWCKVRIIMNRIFQSRRSGAIAAIVSAVLYGVLPVLTKIVYAEGCNVITVSFCRSVFAVLALFLLIRFCHIPLRITRKEFVQVVLVCGFASTATLLLLNASYEYIPAAAATSLHFIYPMLVAGCNIFFFRERVTATRILSLIFGLGGTLLFFERLSNSRTLGLALALLSGITYSILLLGVEHLEIGKQHFLKICFYQNLVAAVLLGSYGASTSTLNLFMSYRAWVLLFFSAMAISVGAASLMYFAVSAIGASTAAILSTLEPITCVLFGFLLLGETLPLYKGLGVVLILLSVILAALPKDRKKRSLQRYQSS